MLPGMSIAAFSFLLCVSLSIKPSKLKPAKRLIIFLLLVWMAYLFLGSFSSSRNGFGSLVFTRIWMVFLPKRWAIPGLKLTNFRQEKGFQHFLEYPDIFRYRTICASSNKIVWMMRHEYAALGQNHQDEESSRRCAIFLFTSDARSVWSISCDDRMLMDLSMVIPQRKADCCYFTVYFS